MSVRVGSPLLMIVVVLPVTVLIGGLDFFAISAMVRQAQVASWPSAQGTITRSEVVMVHTSKGYRRELKLAYTYSVDGQPYEGDKHSFNAGSSGIHRYEEEQLARYPLGASVPVYYRPGQPSEAVLQAGMDSWGLFTLMGAMPFNLVMFWLWVVVRWTPKKEEPFRLSTFIREDGSECVTLDGPRPAIRVSLALVGASQACFALGGFMGGFTAPLPVGVGTWGVIIACGVLAGRWARERLKSGHHDVRLHTQARSLSLPPFSERKHRLDVRWRDVRSLRVEPQLHMPKKERVSSYQLTLQLSTADGEARQEAIASFPDQEEADALAHWLRTHLEVGEGAPEELRSA
ncbi:DUF3592 domain-containing protein [Myxococcus sp. CA051A]|uniref:DUF3592 domain-containing protein n=1 Tax=Myxococcus sp. CA051A TaxID=2741739 RepID=UPI00157B2872|nr:DUF3592 domain-containing protein [Myxococcus sp. CA051A]NTX66819.1 DUF3592 domain-containing protein [Myxococcus sp. CA051A]